MEKPKIETGPKIFPEYNREEYESIFLQRVREISQQNTDLSAELHTGKLNLEAPVREELLAHLGNELTELREVRDELGREVSAIS